MRKQRLLVCSLFGVIGIVVGAWLWYWVRIDICLDRGGAWDDKRGICIGSTSG